MSCLIFENLYIILADNYLNLHAISMAWQCNIQYCTGQYAYFTGCRVCAGSSPYNALSAPLIVRLPMVQAMLKASTCPTPTYLGVHHDHGEERVLQSC